MKRLFETKEEARAALSTALAAASLAAEILRPHLELIGQFERETNLMDSVGPILDPTLFKDPERRATEALVKPIFRAAKTYVAAVDAQKQKAAAALAQVKGKEETNGRLD